MSVKSLCYAAIVLSILSGIVLIYTFGIVAPPSPTQLILCHFHVILVDGNTDLFAFSFPNFSQMHLRWQNVNKLTQFTRAVDDIARNTVVSVMMGT